MAVRPFPLGDKVDGINLMRSKGGATPASLFDLKNGWITSKRTIKARPGTAAHLTFPVGTKGAVGFEGKFHTFATSAPAGDVDARVTVHVLRHPDGAASALSRVHRAFPFLGSLYVVAEFEDGVVQHYWLETPTEWVGGTVYSYGATVGPTADNGLVYENLTRDATAAWQANTEVALGTERQPTTVNGFRYEVTAVTGAAPIRTSNTEPTWPTTEGATVKERRYITEAQTRPGGPDPDYGDDPPPSGGSGGEYGPFPPWEPETRPL